MKKTLLKVLITILVITFVAIGQGYVKDYYNIDSRIWFLVLYAVAFIGLISISAIFNKEFKTMKRFFANNSISDIFYNIGEKFEPLKLKTTAIIKKFEPLKFRIIAIIKKFATSTIFKLLLIISVLVASAGIWYQLFFGDLVEMTILYIVFLVLCLFNAIAYLIRTKYDNQKDGLPCILWFFMFTTYTVMFIF